MLVLLLCVVADFERFFIFLHDNNFEPTLHMDAMCNIFFLFNFKVLSFKISSSAKAKVQDNCDENGRKLTTWCWSWLQSHPANRSPASGQTNRGPKNPRQVWPRPHRWPTHWWGILITIHQGSVFEPVTNKGLLAHYAALYKMSCINCINKFIFVLCKKYFRIKIKPYLFFARNTLTSKSR